MLNRRIITTLLSLEDSALTLEATESELEYVWYAHLPDLSELKDQAQEVIPQEQIEYRLKSPSGKKLGTMRTRKTPDGVKLTVKLYNAEGPGCMETSSDVDNDMHDAFQQFADRMLKKTRYILPVEVSHGDRTVSCQFEVDVFERPDGTIEPWVKIDFEVPEQGFPVPPLPALFNSAEIINASFDARKSAEDQQRIDEIYNRVRTQLKQ